MATPHVAGRGCPLPSGEPHRFTSLVNNGLHRPQRQASWKPRNCSPNRLLFAPADLTPDIRRPTTDVGGVPPSVANTCVGGGFAVAKSNAVCS